MIWKEASRPCAREQRKKRPGAEWVVAHRARRHGVGRLASRVRLRDRQRRVVAGEERGGRGRCAGRPQHIERCRGLVLRQHIGPPDEPKPEVASTGSRIPAWNGIVIHWSTNCRSVLVVGRPRDVAAPARHCRRRCTRVRRRVRIGKVLGIGEVAGLHDRSSGGGRRSRRWGPRSRRRDPTPPARRSPSRARSHCRAGSGTASRRWRAVPGPGPRLRCPRRVHRRSSRLSS
jgi:hypothetical protein